MDLVGFGLAALVGLSLGLLGGGGSILTVPILVYALGFDPKTAIAMSLPIVGAISLVGGIGHWRAGNVRLASTLVFGLVAMAGAFAGARLGTLLTGATQLVILAVVMLAAAVSMFRGGTLTGLEARTGARGATVLLLATGAGVGVLAGLVGIGGGFLIVPALVLLAGLPMKQAVGTSLVVIAMNSAAGTLGHLGQLSLPWTFMAVFVAVAVAGVLVGAALVRVVPHHGLQRAFAGFLLAVGVFILYQNRTAFGAGPEQAAAVDAR